MADVVGDARFDVVPMLQLIEHIVESDRLLRRGAPLAPAGRDPLYEYAQYRFGQFPLFRDRHMHVSSFGQRKPVHARIA